MLFCFSLQKRVLVQENLRLDFPNVVRVIANDSRKGDFSDFVELFYREGRRRQIVFVPIPISSSEIMKLPAQEASKRRPYHRSLQRQFRQSPGKKIYVRRIPKKQIEKIKN